MAGDGAEDAGIGFEKSPLSGIDFEESDIQAESPSRTRLTGVGFEPTGGFDTPRKSERPRKSQVPLNAASRASRLELASSLDDVLPTLCQHEVKQQASMRNLLRDLSIRKEEVQQETEELEKMAARLRKEVVRVQEAGMSTRNLLFAKRSENESLRKTAQETQKVTKQLRERVLRARGRLVHAVLDGTGWNDKGLHGDQQVHALAAACENLHQELTGRQPTDVRRHVQEREPDGPGRKRREDDWYGREVVEVSGKDSTQNVEAIAQSSPIESEDVQTPFRSEDATVERKHYDWPNEARLKFLLSTEEYRDAHAKMVRRQTLFSRQQPVAQLKRMKTI
jgi:hypothetical protein